MAGEPIDDRILPVSPILPFLQPGLTPLPTVQIQLRWWWFEYHPSEIPGSEGLTEDFEFGDFDVFAADAGGEGDRDFSDLTRGLDLGHRASLSVAYDQH